RRHTRFSRDWSSDVCSSDLAEDNTGNAAAHTRQANPRSDHWAYQPISKPELPATATADWVRTPVDAFILQGIESKGLSPAPEARSEERRVGQDGPFRVS